ncbi:unnamed protein product [Victoria cruziana]
MFIFCRSEVNAAWFIQAEDEASQDERDPVFAHPLMLMLLKVAVKGAFVQSVLTRPPCVAQSSASHRLAYNLIACLFG